MTINFEPTLFTLYKVTVIEFYNYVYCGWHGKLSRLELHRKAVHISQI